MLLLEVGPQIIYPSSLVPAAIAAWDFVVAVDRDNMSVDVVSSCECFPAPFKGARKVKPERGVIREAVVLFVLLSSHVFFCFN